MDSRIVKPATRKEGSFPERSKKKEREIETFNDFRLKSRKKLSTPGKKRNELGNVVRA